MKDSKSLRAVLPQGRGQRKGETRHRPGTSESQVPDIPRSSGGAPLGLAWRPPLLFWPGRCSAAALSLRSHTHATYARNPVTREKGAQLARLFKLCAVARVLLCPPAAPSGASDENAAWLSHTIH